MFDFVIGLLTGILFTFWILGYRIEVKEHLGQVSTTIWRSDERVCVDDFKK